MKFLCATPPKVPIYKVHGGCDQLDFDDEKFETVCSVFLLHYLCRTNHSQSRDAIVDILKEAHRTLKPAIKYWCWKAGPLDFSSIWSDVRVVMPGGEDVAGYVITVFLCRKVVKVYGDGGRVQ